MQQYIAQGIGFVGMLLCFLSFQYNTKKRILIFNACAAAAFAIHFLMLGRAGYTGAFMNLIEIGRNLVFASAMGQKRKRIWVPLFMASFFVIGLLSWESMFSLLPVFAMIISTYILSLESTKQIRLLFFPVSIGWIIYNVYTSSIAGVLTESGVLTSLVIAYFRFDFREHAL